MNSTRASNRKSEARGAVYLTFDDGPDLQFTTRILDLLEFFQVRASFFVLGSACERHPALLQRMVAEGHCVGNHTQTHAHPWWISAERARAEVREAQRSIESIGGHAPRLFRPPYGRRRKPMLDEAQRLGMRAVYWDRSAIDWGPLASIDSISKRLAKVKAGDVVLCHDAPMANNRPDATLAVLPAFIEDCQRRNLRFATLDELYHPCQTTLEPRSLSAVQSV